MTIIDYRLEWNGLVFALGWAVSMWTQLIMIVSTVYPIMFFYTIINNSSTEIAIFYCQMWSADHTELVQETGSELLVTQNVYWPSCVLSLLKKNFPFATFILKQLQMHFVLIRNGLVCPAKKQTSDELPHTLTTIADCMTAVCCPVTECNVKAPSISYTCFFSRFRHYCDQDLVLNCFFFSLWSALGLADYFENKLTGLRNVN